MTQLPAFYRPAGLDDARDLAQLVNLAGEGLPLYLWTQMCEQSQTPWRLGEDRARRESGSFSYRNAIVRQEQAQVQSCLIGYALEDDPEPSNYEEMPEMFVPLQQLEDLAPGTWYINVLATFPDYRKRGFGSELLGIAEGQARESHKHGLSLIVADANTQARRLYEHLGFIEHSRRQMIKEQWQNPSETWVLMLKDLE